MTKDVVAGDGNASQPEGALSGLAVPVQRLHPLAVLPHYALPGDAGADLACTEAVRLAPGERAVVPTGIALALPPGYAAFVHPRSGLAARVGLALVNSPGTIDSGYRGEIKLIVINLDPAEAVHLDAGDRIAQLVIQRVEYGVFSEVDQLPASDRGAAGYGSTGGAAGLAAVRPRGPATGR
jgi:dUTP pyrophosphatase